MPEIPVAPNPQEAAAKPKIRIPGAFEVFEGKRENLLTITRGKLLEAGDKLPPVAGKVHVPEGQEPPTFDFKGEPEKVYVINVVNACGTPDCTSHIKDFEELHRQHPNVEAITVSKEDPHHMQIEHEQPGEITHTRVSIDDEAAADWGVGLEPGAGADPEFWPGALRRTTFVVKDGNILEVYRHEDQAERPDFEDAFAKATAASIIA